MPRGTRIHGNFVSDSKAIGVLIFGKVLIIIGISLLINGGIRYGISEYQRDIGIGLLIGGGVFFALGLIFACIGGFIYYRIRKNPERYPPLNMPTAVAYPTVPPPAGYPAVPPPPGYPGATVYQHGNAYGAFPGQMQEAPPGYSQNQDINGQPGFSLPQQTYDSSTPYGIPPKQ